MGDFRFIIGLEEARDKLLPLGKQEVNRGKHPNPYPDERCAEHSEFFRHVFCDAFRRDFTEEQHDNRYHYRGNRRANIAVNANEEQRANGSHRDIHDVVANENSENQLVVVFRKLQSALCFFVPVICENLQTRLAQR